MTDGEKQCSKCAHKKKIEDFSWDSTNNRYSSACKPCRAKTTLAYQRTQAGKESTRRARLKHLYNLTVAQYDEMLEAQGGGCAICGVSVSQRDRNFSVDHDHSCCPGKRSCGDCVRGLLCLRCNNSLGWMETHILAVETYLARQ